MLYHATRFVNLLEKTNLPVDTESLVWRRIPSNVIIAHFRWADICNSLGQILPPLSELVSVRKSGNCPLESSPGLIGYYED
jgi:hypothetical protein